MASTQAHAGNGPAPLPAPAGAEDQDFTDKHVVPAVSRLHSALASCDALIAELAQRATDMDYAYDARTKFALAAARLASSQAQTAGAIARLADAESRQRVTNIKVDDSVFRPRRRRTTADVNRALRNNRSHDSYDTRDWENDESKEEKTTFNSPGNSKPAFTGPRIRQV